MAQLAHSDASISGGWAWLGARLASPASWRGLRGSWASMPGPAETLSRRPSRQASSPAASVGLRGAFRLSGGPAVSGPAVSAGSPSQSGSLLSSQALDVSQPGSASSPSLLPHAPASQLARRSSDPLPTGRALTTDDLYPRQCLTSLCGSRAPASSERAPGSAASAPTRPVSSASTAWTSAVSASARRLPSSASRRSVLAQPRRLCSGQSLAGDPRIADRALAFALQNR
jgi:hypothetical protein